MGSCNRKIVEDVPPYLRIYEDGTIERLLGTEVTLATFDPDTKVSSKDVTVLAGVSARLYRPDSISKNQKVPLVVYFHGGAFCISSPSDPAYHNFLNLVAAQAQIIIVSVDYRLAPEYPLPTAYEDSWAVLKWAIEQNSGEGREDWLRENVDFSKVFLAGDSAGANISHHMAIRAGRSEHPVKFAGIAMLQPYFWGKNPIGSEAKSTERKAMIDKWWNFVCPSDKGCDDPLINPFIDNSSFKRLECTERILVCIAENDILRERGRLYYESLGKSGWKGKAELLESKGEDHVFFLFNPRCENAQILISSFAAFINQV